MNKNPHPPKEEKKTHKGVAFLVVLCILSTTGTLSWHFLKDGSPRAKAESQTSAQEEDAAAFTRPALVQGFSEPEESPRKTTPPILAVPESEGGTASVVPKAFGLQSNKAGSPAQPPKASQDEPENEAVALQKPEPPALPKPTAKLSQSPEDIKSIDPRTIGVTANDGPEKEFEETSLTVQRTLTAVLSGGDKQMIRLRVPVMYRSRSLRLEGASLEEAKRIHSEMKSKSEALGQLKKDMEKLLSDWNKLVEKTTPHEALLPESPTLPQNQSAGKLNRKENPDMEAGKAISYEIVSPDAK